MSAPAPHSSASRASAPRASAAPSVNPWTKRLVVGLLGLLLAAVAVAAGAAIIMIIADSTSDAGFQVIAMAIVAAMHFALMLGAAWMIRGGRLVPLMALVFPTAAIGLALSLTLIGRAELQPGWEPHFNALLAAIMGTADVIALALVHTGLFTGVVTKAAPLTILKWCVAALAWLVTGELIVLAWLGWFELAVEGLYPMTLLQGMAFGGGVGAGLVIVSTLGLRIAARVHARRLATQTDTLARAPTISMTCPACQMPQSFAPGLARCTDCGFTMMIELEEPRCECGYLLYRLDATSCPECGRPVGRARPASTEPVSCD